MAISTESSKRQLVDKLIIMTIVGSMGIKEPGYIIKRLNKEDRELVKQLKSNDFNHRLF